LFREAGDSGERRTKNLNNVYNKVDGAAAYEVRKMNWRILGMESCVDPLHPFK
jgi:hypothetical protein